MRHFDFLADAECDRLFLRAPQEFGVDAAPDLLGTAMGAALYCPATRPQLAQDVRRCASAGVVSVVICLEDAVADDDVPAAQDNAVRQLRELAAGDDALPMVFVRVRAVDQIASLVADLGDDARALTGFVVPKFTEDNASAYLDAVVQAGERIGRRLLVMPVLESAQLGHLESRVDALLGVRRLIDKYRELVPAIRVGATDLSAAWALRRARDLTVWDVRVVADVLSAVVNVFGRVGDAAPDYVVAGPVWEYYPATERLFKPQLRESPFAAHDDRALRAELIAADLDGLIREVVLDRANGLIGKTVIHPTHVAAVHALSVVTAEEDADARDVLATDGCGGAAASSFGNKMNESKPHTAWARRTMLRAHAFGVARDGVSFVDLLGAGLHG
ncbi:HpcH/HpaI aldolase/citrate lyase family protein [uncultured Jatrophihabitans sp.]|uniref:HpcH/HpaI aldolase/citrate lyase family protein n=1 Tax=uncultured Jatrophihabitans sp. TaxID=1610747 RepID=UPI0035CA87E5